MQDHELLEAARAARLSLDVLRKELSDARKAWVLADTESTKGLARLKSVEALAGQIEVARNAGSEVCCACCLQAIPYSLDEVLALETREDEKAVKLDGAARVVSAALYEAENRVRHAEGNLSDALEALLRGAGA